MSDRPSLHFSWLELACHDAQRTPVPDEYRANAIAVCAEAEWLRGACGGYPLTVTRCYSTPEHNATIPGAARYSLHLTASAIDALPPGHMRTDDFASVVVARARSAESRIRYIKVYRDGHVHFDIRPGATLLVEYER